MPHATAEARRAYQQKWRAEHPAYHQAWNEAHQKQERVRKARWKKANPGRHNSHDHRVAPPSPPLPLPWMPEHPLIERAWALLEDRGFARLHHRGQAVAFVEDEMVLDAVGVAVLAMLCRKDPEVAVTRFLARERDWRVRAAPYLLDEGSFED